MRLYGAIQKVEPQDDGTVRVHGIATSEAVDEQGEIVRADAIRAAIPDYMRFPALREMHQLSAAGTTLEAEVCDDGTTRIVAHVVDPVAVAKVRNQVYRGFSIGGRVTQREAGNPKTITGLVLNEISLVDRPANPEAIFDCWKSAIAPDAPLGSAEAPVAKRRPAASIQVPLAREPFDAPIQIWACSVPDHRHLAKADALKCLKGDTGPEGEIRGSAAARATVADSKKTVSGAEFRQNTTESSKTDHSDRSADPGYQPDGRVRYPIDTNRHFRAAWAPRINRPDTGKQYTGEQLKRVRDENIAGWKAKIGTDGPPAAEDRDEASRASLTGALRDVSQIARVITELDWLRDALELEAAIENDQSPQPFRLQAIINELCDFLNSLATEEIGEISGETETDGLPPASAMPGMLDTAVGASDIERVAASLQKGDPNMQHLAAGIVAKAKHSQADQALLNMAHLACDQCLKIGGLSVDKQANMDRARHHLQEAGAMPTPPWTAEKAGNRDLSPASLGCPMGDTADVDTVRVLRIVTEVLCKRERDPQNLMDLAHECLKALTDGRICEQAAKFGARHSKQTMEDLNASHRHLAAAGAECNATSVDEPRLPAQLASGTDTRAADLANALPDERAEKAALTKVLGEVVPMIEQLAKRVDEIARTPLPPLTMAKGSISVSKQQDRGSDVGSGDPEMSPEAVAAALAKMSKEEQTLTLIKASYATPIRIPGLAADQR